MTSTRTMPTERTLNILGQIGGWFAGAAWLFNFVKDFIGFVGILAGATLSVWALYDRWKKHKAGKDE